MIAELEGRKVAALDPTPDGLFRDGAFEQLAASLLLDMRECFRPRELGDEELNQVLTRMREEEFTLGDPSGEPGNDAEEWSNQDIAALYLVVAALREL